MTSSAMRGFRRGLLLAATGFIFAAGPVRAQDSDEPMPEPQHSQLPPGAVVQALDSGPGAELRRNLSALAQNPRSLDALIGAGRAAIRLGDGEAATGFFTRAREIAPDDPRVKAGMASAMLFSERPEQALILFAEAIQRGAPEAEIAGDRGLAYDMVGDPRHAQQDYALALRRRNDPEVERRLALSLAISGQRDAALRVIDGQLRRQDRAAWRTQAFVLALSGDPAGADDTARRILPAPNAAALSPFFARLASLSPAQKAAAVNFGRFPSDGRATRFASNVDTSADPSALAMARGGPRPQPPLAEPVNDAPRRRPDLGEQPVNSLIRRPRQEVAPPVQPQRRIETAQAQPPRRFAPQPQPDPDDEDQSSEDARQQEAPPQRSPVNRPREAPAFVPGGNFTLDTSHEERIPQPPVQAPVQSATPGFGSVAPSQPPLQRFQPVPDQNRTAPARQDPGFSDIANLVYSLPDRGDAAARQAPPSAPLSLAERQARDAAAREAEARYRSGGAPASAGARAGSSAGTGRSAAESRHWVQIAHGSQRAALAVQYRQVHAQAPALVESRPAWTVADRDTNRLLIGPFDDERSAQDLIDQLSQRHIAAVPWTSTAGQSIDRLGGGGAPATSAARVRETPPPRPARTRRSRQADEGDTASDRHGSRRGSGHGASASDERPSPHSRAGRAAAAEERASSHRRSGHADASDERNGAHGRSGRGRAGADDSSSTHSRSRRGHQSDEESQSSHGRSGSRHGSADTGNSSSHGRTAHGRAAANDDAHSTSRNRSSQERRQSAHDTRTSRGRSSEEQRPAPSRRRSH